MIKEPKRMSEEPSVLGASVTATREGLPSDERLAALAARLTAAGAAVDFEPAPKPHPSAETGPAEAQGVSGLHWGPRALGAGMLALLCAGVITWMARERAPAASHVEAPPSVAATNTSRPSAASTAPTATPMASPPPGAPRSTTKTPPAEDATPQAPAAEASSLPASGALVAPSATTRPDLVETSPQASAGAREALPRPARSPSGKSSAASSDANPGGPLAAGNVVTSELELLKQARSALAADPAQAFALTERCRGQYPSGDLAQEREYIAISALVRLGRSSEASSRAALFRMHYPSSAYLPRLSRLLDEP